MNFDVESLKQQIPHYLTAEDKQVLVKELAAIAGGKNIDYFLNRSDDSFIEHMLQGDGWAGFQLFLFETGERKSLRGVVLSNSCDVDPDNLRDIPARVIFAPLVKLEKYIALLDSSGIDKDKINAKIASIRAQKTSNIFFMPSSGLLTDDYVVRFDEAHSMPVVAHAKSDDRQKLFTLSNTGFYLFVLKLSIHFCRLQERVNRKPKRA